MHTCIHVNIHTRARTHTHIHTSRWGRRYVCCRAHTFHLPPTTTAWPTEHTHTYAHTHTHTHTHIPSPTHVLIRLPLRRRRRLLKLICTLVTFLLQLDAMHVHVQHASNTLQHSGNTWTCSNVTLCKFMCQSRTVTSWPTPPPPPPGNLLDHTCFIDHA